MWCEEPNNHEGHNAQEAHSQELGWCVVVLHAQTCTGPCFNTAQPRLPQWVQILLSSSITQCLHVPLSWHNLTLQQGKRAGNESLGFGSEPIIGLHLHSHGLNGTYQCLSILRLTTAGRYASCKLAHMMMYCCSGRKTRVIAINHNNFLTSTSDST